MEFVVRESRICSGSGIFTGNQNCCGSGTFHELEFTGVEGFAV